jgi:hypothetical protein
MGKIGFADESGTDSLSPCYSIGVILVDSVALGDFDGRLQSLKSNHNIQHELKWNKISNSHGAINFLLGSLDCLLSFPGITFDVIVVRKDVFRNWQGGQENREQAFYQTYTLLLKHILQRTKDVADILIDNRSDSYPKQHEVVETIGNRMLAKLHSKGRLNSVRKVDSKQHLSIQVADIITGLINAGHNIFLKPDYQLNSGKRLAIQRAGQMLGWDRLCYDTFPHPQFNIWHFPIEFRAIPGSREPIPTLPIPWIVPADLDSVDPRKSK